MHTARTVPAALFLLATLSAPLYAQSPANGAIEGTVVSLGRDRVTIHADGDGGDYVVVRLNGDTDRPAEIAPGSRVRVEPTAASAGDSAPAAATVTVLEAAPQGRAAPAPLPEAVRRVERQIERNARRFSLGARTGIALDPEMVLLGVHATLGPIFSPRVVLRPNAEIAWGELTTLVAVNVEALYRITALGTGNTWAPYAGGGMSFGFNHRGFSPEDGRDFDDLDLNGGLSLLAGVERPSGVFVELKTTLYTVPTFRMMLGFTF